MTLTYLGVHLLFVLPPLALLLWLRPSLPPARRRRARAALLLLGTLAFAYTTPWDNLMIERGVWFYGEGRVAARLWAAPVGEYLFFALQTALVGLWFHRVGVDPAPFDGDLDRPARAAGALAWLAAGAVGGWLVVAGPERFLYLGATLAWACPVLALQWAVGGAVLVRRRRAVAVGVAAPTVYLWAVDRLAIGAGVWTVADDTATGVALAGLPVEEAVFFALASLLVAQGLLLFEWAALRWGDEPAAARVRTPTLGRAAGVDRVAAGDRAAPADHTEAVDRAGAGDGAVRTADR